MRGSNFNVPRDKTAYRKDARQAIRDTGGELVGTDD